MGAFLQLGNKTYETDGDDFLENPFTWDESFAEQMAGRARHHRSSDAFPLESNQFYSEHFP